MRKIRHHRKKTATSHEELVPSQMNMVSYEEVLATSLYCQKVQQAYQDCFHFAVHWDPSSYDVETFVSILFSGQCGQDGLACYPPIQNLKPVLKNEVDPEIQALSAVNKLTRVAGYNEIRALSHSLKAVNFPLDRFRFPKDLLWKPLQSHETRVWSDGQYWVVDTRTGEKRPQLPSDFCIETTPLLISVSDQGGINRAGLDYLVYKLGLSMHIQFDPYHRGWNDLKDTLKKSKGDLFKCFLSFALVFNVNYGPFGSKEWFQRKQSMATDLVNSTSPHEEPFVSFIPWICKERKVAEPQSAQEREQLFNSLLDMNHIRALGPIVKLMRWYSWFQCERYYSGECWGLKLIMLQGRENCSPNNCCQFVRQEESISLPTSGLTDKQELRQLKMKHGTWALAPLLVTPASMFQKDLIKLLA